MIFQSAFLYTQENMEIVIAYILKFIIVLLISIFKIPTLF